MERIIQTASAIRHRFEQSFIFPIILAFTCLFLWFHNAMGELKLLHFAYTGAILTLFYLHKQSRIFIILALPIILKEMIFDSLRYVPFDWLTPIRVIEPYAIDKFLFGININGVVVLFHEYLLNFTHPALDFFFGAIYHLLAPIMFIYVLIFWKWKSTDLASRFSCAFLLMNLFAFATYLLYPAAAPWYINQYGFVQPISPIIGNAAGLANFDQIIGTNFSNNMYSANPVVFGAIPSMHVGFTVLAWFYSFHVNKKICLLAGLFALLSAIAALYLQHHYMIDVVLGALYALVAYILIEKFLLQFIQKGYQNLLRLAMKYGGRTLFNGKSNNI